MIREQPFSVLVYISNLVILLVVTIDLYFAASSSKNANVEYSALGFLTFIILYVFILARRFSLAFQEV